MSVVSKILTIGGAMISTIGVSLGAAEGSPGLLAIGLGSLLFILGVFKNIKSELQTPVFVDWWKHPIPVEWGEWKKPWWPMNVDIAHAKTDLCKTVEKNAKKHGYSMVEYLDMAC